MLQISLLAPRIEIIKNGEAIDFPGKKGRLLFSYLLLNKDRKHSREKLAGIFWRDFPSDRARSNLNNTIWLLNKLLKEKKLDTYLRLNSNNYNISLQLEKDVDIDTEQLTCLLNKIEENSTDKEKSFLLDKALQLTSNSLLEEEDESWLRPERTRFEEISKKILLRLIKIHKSKGHYYMAYNVCQKALHKYTLNEGFEYNTILLLYLMGKKNEAVQEYYRFSRLLKDGLNIKPGQKLKLLIRDITEDSIEYSKHSMAEMSNSKITEELPLIGCTDEINLYQSILINSVKQQQTALVTVLGTAGTGKSRLLQKIFRVSTWHNADVLVLDNFSINKEENTYSLVSRLVEKIINWLPERALSDLSSDAVQNLSHLLPQIGQKLNKVNTKLKIEGFNFRLLYDTISYLLKFKKNPLVIIIDDINKADVESLNFLDKLLLLQEQSLIVVQSLRSEYKKEPRVSLPERTFEIRLKPLNKEETQQLLNKLLKLANNSLNINPTEFSNYIYAQTGGNPFFIQEILKFWRQKNILLYDSLNKKWLFHESLKINQQGELPEKIEMPVTLNSLYQSRLECLDRLELDIIQLASLLGLCFEKSIIKQLLNLNIDSAENAFQQLINQGFLLNGNYKSCLKFSHIKLREYVYSSISRPRNSFYHHKIYNLYNTLPLNGNRELTLKKLAWHSYQAGIWKDALSCSMEAAAFLAEKCLTFESYHYYNRALEIYNSIYRSSNDETLITIYIGRGNTNFLLGNTDKAINDFERAFELSRKNKDKKMEGKLVTILARANSRIGDFSQTMYYINKALEDSSKNIRMDILLEILDTMSLLAIMTLNCALADTVKSYLEKIIEHNFPENENPILAKAFFSMGHHLLLMYNQYEKAAEYFKKAGEIFRKWEMKEELSILLSFLGSIFSHTNSGTNAADLFEESRVYALKSANPLTISRAYGPIIMAYTNQGQYRTALQCLAEYTSHVPEDPPWQIPYLALKGEVHYLLGDMLFAKKGLNHCLELCKDVDIIEYKIHAMSTLGLVELDMGNKNKGENLLQKAEELAENIPFKLFPAKVSYKKLLFALQNGDYLKLESEADKLLEMAINGHLIFLVGWAHYGLGVVQLSKGNFKKSSQELKTAFKIAAKTLTLSLLWKTSSTLADLSLAVGNLNQAREHYNRSAAVIEEIASPLPEKLRNSFLQKPTVIRTLIRSDRNYIKEYSGEIFKGMGKKSLYSFKHYTPYDWMLVSIIKKQLGRKRMRQFQLAELSLISDSLGKSIPDDRLARLFGVHQRTIRRDKRDLTLEIN